MVWAEDEPLSVVVETGVGCWVVFERGGIVGRSGGGKRGGLRLGW